VLADALVEIESIESSTRGYVATGEPRFLNPLKSNRAAIDQDVELLRGLTIDNTRQQDRIKTLKARIHEKIEFNLELIRQRQAGNADAAIQKLATGEGRQILARLRKTLDEMDAEEKELLAQREAEQQSTVRQTTLVVIGGSAIALLMWLVASFLLFRELKQRHRAEAERDRFFDMALDMLCVVGFDGYFKRVNPAFSKTLGYTREELLSRPYEDILHPDDIASTRAEVARLAAGQLTFSFTNRHRCKDGSYKWLEWTATPYREEGVIYAAARDSTERKRADEALRQALSDTQQARANLDGIIKALSSGLLVTDLQHRVLLMNKAAEQLIGFKGDNCTGRPVEEVLPDAALKDKLALALERPDETLRFDVTLSAQDSRAGKVVRAGLSVVRDAAGAPNEIITVLDDVTREREVDRMKTEFLTTAAHELRTPLTSIRGFSELLLTREMTDEKRKWILQTVNTQSANLASIINDLLDLARIESGRGLVLKRSPTDVSALARTVVATFSNNGKHSYSVESNTGALAFCDPLKIQQVLQNLVSNATKYSPNGGVIKVALSTAGSMVSCAVSDEGIGMSSDQLGRLFTKFFRADASNTAAEGTGLGMSIVKAIVEQHGGTVNVESRLGQGTRVTFTLRQYDNAISKYAAPKSVSSDSGTRRVLILEDDISVVAIMQFCLEHAGYEVHSTGGGKGFIELAARLHPHLICLDCILPDVDGFAIADQLKRDARTHSIPFIFVTVRESERDRASEYGASGFISKPFTEQELMNTVKTVLEKKKQKTTPVEDI
jgi:PAS domain S-box-containing protein